MRRRATVRLQPIEPGSAPAPPAVVRRGDAPPGAARPRHRGLRSTAELPPRARAFLVAAGLALVGFAVWVTVRLLAADALDVAILLIVLSYLGAVVIGVAVVTLTRLAFSLRALPYLLGRGVRGLLWRALRRLAGRR